MATHKLDLSSLTLFDDGKTQQAFDSRLRAAIADMVERPGDDRPRKVKMEVILKPDLDPATLELRSVDVQTKVVIATPAAVSSTLRTQPRKSRDGAMLLFDETDALESFDGKAAP
jgi:hypothetical protein